MLVKTKNKSGLVDAAEIDEILLELANKSLYEFIKQGWPLIEANAFVPGWHIEAVCEHLEAVSRGDIKNLAVIIPPRHTKSGTVSVAWPAWEWGPFNKPGSQWLAISYAQKLSLRDSLKCRNLIQSRWYQKRWGNRFKIVGDQNAKERYNNDKNGYRIATSVGGVATGEGGTRLLIDDPHNIKEIESEAAREDVINWWDSVMPTRMNDPKNTGTVLIMQRSRHDDLAGHIKETVGEDWEWLVLPTEFETTKRCRTRLSPTKTWKDPRKKDGELLWANRYGDKEIKALKKRLGSQNYEAQCQQNPTEEEGGIIKRSWWRYYNNFPPIPLKDFDFIFQSWDLAFKALDTSAYVVGTVWGLKGPNVYLLDRQREHLTFTESCRAITSMKEKWPLATAIYIEDAANGPAVIDSLKRKVPGIIAVKPNGSKESRAFAMSPDIEAGNGWLPDKSLAPWVDEYITQIAQFPKGAYADDMDSTSQAFAQAKKRQTHLGMIANMPSVGGTMRTEAR